MGSPDVDGRLTNDVCLDEIPIIEGGFQIQDAATLTILGDAPKVLLVGPGREDAAEKFIAKAPRCEGPRECVTEYLISEIGRTLPVRRARGRLVRMKERCGPVPGALDVDSKNFCPEDVRFLSRYFLHKHEQLVHGIELVAGSFDVTDVMLQREVRGRAAERQFYTVDLIDRVLESVARSETTYAALRDSFARMMAFDALVGANDRHPQNWGVITNVLDAKVAPRFAPIFDSARGLLWNNRDSRLFEWDERGDRMVELQKYSLRSTPLIGVEGYDNPNHFDVIDYMVNRSQRGFGAAIRSVIMSFSPRRCGPMVHGAVGRFFSRRRLRCIVDLLCYRHRHLVEICRGERPDQLP